MIMKNSEHWLSEW